MNEEVKTYNMTQGLSKTTSLLINKLRDGRPGDVLTDGELTAICGRPTHSNSTGYGNLQTAIRHVLNNYNLLWERIPGAGCIKCKNSQEAAASASKDIVSVKRKAKKSIKKLGTIDYDKVNDVEKRKLLSMTAQLGAITMFASSDTRKKLEAREAVKAPELTEVIELFKT